MVVLHGRFGTTYWCHLLLGPLEPRRLDRYVVPKRRYETTILRCVESQKNADLIWYDVVQYVDESVHPKTARERDSVIKH